MSVRTICFRQYTPTIYNKGTQFESSCDTFLATMFCGSLEETQAYADKLNTEKPEKLFTGEPALCDERFYFADEAEI